MAVVRYPLGQESALVIQLANLASIAVTSALRWFSYRAWVFPALDAESRTGPEREELQAQAHVVA